MGGELDNVVARLERVASILENVAGTSSSTVGAGAGARAPPSSAPSSSLKPHVAQYKALVAELTAGLADKAAKIEPDLKKMTEIWVGAMVEAGRVLECMSRCKKPSDQEQKELVLAKLFTAQKSLGEMVTKDSRSK